MTTYIETALSSKDTARLHSRLNAKHFFKTQDTFYEEKWENPETEEIVIVKIEYLKVEA